MAEKIKKEKKVKKEPKKEKKKEEEKITGGKIFTIPLRKAYEKSKKKRAKYAAKIVREFLATHMKNKNVKLGKNLNEKLWERGIEKPPRRVRVRVIVDAGVVKAELMGYAYRDFRAKPKKEGKGMRERLMDRLGAKALRKQEEEEKLSDAKTPEKAEKMEKHSAEKHAVE